MYSIYICTYFKLVLKYNYLFVKKVGKEKIVVSRYMANSKAGCK